MTGKEVKKMITESGLKCWQVAEAWGLCDSNFSRRLRKPFSDEEVCRLKEKYGKGQTIRRREGFIFRAAEENLPESFERVSNITLEDVYLFYAEGRA